MNKSQAAHYYKLAADQGHADAQVRYEALLAQVLQPQHFSK
jgi:TPR repeat protein